MSGPDVNSLIEHHLSKSLNEIFHLDAKSELPAVVVLYDPTWGITGRFRSSGYTNTFKKIFPKQLDYMRRSGLEIGDMGLLKRAATRFQAHPDEMWAYAIEITSKNIFEAKISSKVVGNNKWNPIPNNKIKPGRQLNEIIKDVRDKYSQAASGKHLIIIPYSASETFLGLVLLVWLTDELPPRHLPKALGFLQSQGVLLSAHQSVLVASAADARADGYRRLASLVRHEENGFVQTLEGLLGALTEAPGAKNIWKRLGMTEEDIKFLKTTMESKKDLNSELSSDDPLHNIDSDLLYMAPSDIKEELPGIIKYIKAELDERSFTINTPRFGKGIKGDSKVDIKLWVIERIIRNAVKNSEEAFINQRSKNNILGRISINGSSKVRLNIFVDILKKNGKRSVELVIEDDAGGIQDESLPREITPQIWTRYRAENEFAAERGNGFWIISRYAYSSGGQFRLEDVVNSKGIVIGVRYRITLGLRI
jgi:signal transduction histidine kinase